LQLLAILVQVGGIIFETSKIIKKTICQSIEDSLPSCFKPLGAKSDSDGFEVPKARRPSALSSQGKAPWGDTITLMCKGVALWGYTFLPTYRGSSPCYSQGYEPIAIELRPLGLCEYNIDKSMISVKSYFR